MFFLFLHTVGFWSIFTFSRSNVNMLSKREVEEEQKCKFEKSLNFNLAPEVIFWLSMRKHGRKIGKPLLKITDKIVYGVSGKNEILKVYSLVTFQLLERLLNQKVLCGRMLPIYLGWTGLFYSIYGNHIWIIFVIKLMFLPQLK